MRIIKPGNCTRNYPVSATPHLEFASKRYSFFVLFFMPVHLAVFSVKHFGSLLASLGLLSLSLPAIATAASTSPAPSSVNSSVQSPVTAWAENPAKTPVALAENSAKNLAKTSAETPIESVESSVKAADFQQDAPIVAASLTPIQLDLTLDQAANPAAVQATVQATSNPSRNLGQLAQFNANAQPVTIEYIELTTDGNRLLIRADRNLTYEATWDRSSLAYVIRIPNASFGASLTLPDTSESEVIQWVRAEQDQNGTVSIYVMPAPQVSVRGTNQPSPQMISLELQPYAMGTAGAPASNPGNLNLPVIRDGRVLVVLDPGHGGSDPGAVGIGGLSEIDIVGPISERVAELLEASGVQATLTRTGDYDLELEPRVDMANRLGANLFLSIHANAIDMSRPDVNGIETYYFESGDRFAEAIHDSVIEATGSIDRGVRTARFYVLRNTDMPSVLLEIGFVTGATDAARLSDANYRETLAQAIARGVLQYVQDYCPGPYCQP